MKRGIQSKRPPIKKSLWARLLYAYSDDTSLIKTFDIMMESREARKKIEKSILELKEYQKR